MTLRESLVPVKVRGFVSDVLRQSDFTWRRMDHGMS